MIIGLKEEIEKYALEIKDNYPDYGAIYKYYVEYMDDKYDDIFVNDFFAKKEFNTMDIIKSCAHYVNESNAESKSAVTKYLNALSKFYKDRKHTYRDTALTMALPFSKLANNVISEINKDLDGSQSVLPIRKIEFDNIIGYFENKTQKRHTQLQREIIIRLILLYGFKFIRIQNMEKKNFDSFNGTISVDIPRTQLETETKILPLPKILIDKLNTYLLERKYPDNQLLFLTARGNKFEVANLNYSFRQIEEYSGFKSKSFCTTGLAKYAIIKMLNKNFQPLYIRKITGMEDTLINDCIRIHYESKSASTFTESFESIDTFNKWDH